MRPTLAFLATSAVVLAVGCSSSDHPDGNDGGGPGATSGEIGTSSSVVGSTGSSSSASGTGAGASDVCGTGEWTCVPVPPSGAYGTHTFDVPAAQNWVNTGLALSAGQQATITESGTWSIGGTDTGMPIDHGPCLVGDVVARIGLDYKDPALTCVAGQATFTADKAGILYVGALAGNDLGETYETRRNATGAKSISVTSDGATAPTVEVGEAAGYPYGSVTGGWVEVRSTHVIMTLPTALAAQDAGAIASAAARIDTFYELHEELRGAVPHHGQRIRFFPDPLVVPIGYMLAGNPVRMDPILVDPTFANRITLAGMDGVDVWGFAHELGHDFTFVNGLWWYQENSLESWPNIFSVHALEALGLPLNRNAVACATSAPVDYASWDAWSGLCFLLQFETAHGWPFYQQFFAELNDTQPADLPGGAPAWTFVRDRFNAISGSDVTPIFDAWGVPHP